ncbi:TadE/TadG family type IV pilus assembly protein [Marmoricola sp. URHB0036]|uniref:TadE/TadG family type IV pilus assembly protein n=1 Tax=Marmoricola sp. URHB0036 TaxID=1298863 RepID=UPI0004214169|nr:TadE/TadG family type IV pilus assembly protein [Marmoricola sp. URHB0036]
MNLPARSRVRGESGASAIELVLYMPILMFTILFAVQFSLVYLGGQVASGAAREAARTARVTGNAGQAQAVGERIVRQIGRGVLDDARVEPRVGAEQARVTVSGQASQILPFLPIPRVSETVEGPVERFVQDAAP